MCVCTTLVYNTAQSDNCPSNDPPETIIIAQMMSTGRQGRQTLK